MINENIECRYCHSRILEPIWFVSDIFYFKGLFWCPICKKEHSVIKIEDNLIYEYPFEEIR